MKRRSRRTTSQSSCANSSPESKRKVELELDPNEISATPKSQPSPVAKVSQQLKKKRGAINRSRRTTPQSSCANSSLESKRKGELELDPNEISASPKSQPSPVVKVSQQLKKKRGAINRGKKKKAGKKILKVKFALPKNKIHKKTFKNDTGDASQMNEIESNSDESDIEESSQMNEIEDDSYGKDIEESLNEIENHSFANENNFDDAIEEQEIQTSLIDELARTIYNQDYSIIDNLPFALSRQEFKRSSIIDEVTYRLERSEILSKYIDKCFFADKSKPGKKQKKKTSNIDCGVKQKGDFVVSSIDCALETSEVQEASEFNDNWFREMNNVRPVQPLLSSNTAQVLALCSHYLPHDLGGVHPFAHQLLHNSARSRHQPTPETTICTSHGDSQI